MNADSAQEIRSLACGVRAVALALTVIVSYFNVRLALQINHFGRIFDDMLGGKPLPTITNIVLHNNTVFLLLALAVPVAAIAVVAMVRNHKYALYGLAALMVVAFLELHLVWTGLFAPLMSIVSGMSG